MDANNKSLVRRQRAPKTTADQYEVFLEYALRNQSIVDNKRDPLDSDLAVQQKWTDLTAILNTSGRGPQRKSKEWQNTFSNWKNSIRHKMKCIMDGTSRNMLTELESRALQLWDLNGYHGLRYQRIKRETLAPSDLTRHGQHDESTHSSVSAFYLGAASAGSGTAGATTGGGILNGIAHVAKEQQQPQSRRMLGNGTNNGNTSNSGHHPNHSEAAALVALARINGGVDGTETDEATASAAGADDDDEPEDNDADDDEEDDDEDEGEGEVEMDNDDDEEGEFEEENSTPHVPATSTPDALPPSKRRKYTTHPYQQRHLAATASAHKLQYGRNGSASSAAVYHRRSAAGRAGADGLDGSILIAESISKLADNVGHIADSIREISAAFTTTTQSAFELIRRQSEIIQTLIEK